MRELSGRAWVYGDKIDTDLLAPGAYMKLPIHELAKHCLEGIDPDFAGSVTPGDIIIAGEGFGMGSSREQAAEALIELGVAAVVAKSCARIFYRNALNLGLPVMVSKTITGVAAGDRVSIDLVSGRLCNLSRNELFEAEPLPAFLLAIVEDGGLLKNLEKRLRAGDIPAQKPKGSPDP